MPRLPLFPLGTVLFPGQPLPLHVFEPRYRLMLQRCLDGDRRFGVVLIREGWEVGETATPHDVGTVARIVRAETLPDGRSLLLAVGESRFRIRSLDTTEPYLQAEVDRLDDRPDEPDRSAAGRDALDLLRSYAGALGAQLDSAQLDRVAADPVGASYAVSAAFQGDLADRQRLLEADTAVARLDLFAALVRRDLAWARAGIPPRTTRPRPASPN